MSRSFDAASAALYRDSHLQLLIAGADSEGPDAGVLATIRGGAGPPPAISLSLQDLLSAPLDQEVDQSSKDHGQQDLSEHGAQRRLGQG